MVLNSGAAIVAIDAACAREVAPRARTARLPGAPPFVPGVVNARGVLVPLVDLGALLAPGSIAVPQWMVVVESAGRRCALAVDSLPVLSAADAPAVASPNGAPFLTREVRVADVTLPLLDVEALLDVILLQ